MKALRLHGVGDLRVDQVPEPDRRLADNEVLVRVSCCGICGSDVHAYRHGLDGISMSLPQIMGHEISGVAMATGQTARGVRVGARVSVMPLSWCGHCVNCRAGMPTLCTSLRCVGWNVEGGGMAEYLIVRDDQIGVLPDNVSDEAGTMVEPTAVAVRAVSLGSIGPGDTVLVTGGGPIGQLCVMASIARGAGFVALSDRNLDRRNLAARVGAALTLDPASDDIPEALHEATKGTGVDVVVECSGSMSAVQTAISTVRSAGTIVQCGVGGEPANLDLTHLTQREIVLRGTLVFPVDCWPSIIKLISDGRIDVTALISDRVALDVAVADGFVPLTRPARPQMKVVISVN